VFVHQGTSGLRDWELVPSVRQDHTRRFSTLVNAPRVLHFRPRPRALPISGIASAMPDTQDKTAARAWRAQRERTKMRQETLHALNVAQTPTRRRPPYRVRHVATTRRHPPGVIRKTRVYATRGSISTAGRVRSVLWAGIRETQTTLRAPHAHTGNTRVFLVPSPVYHVYSIHSRFLRRGAQSAFVARGTFRKTSPWSDRRANRARQTHTST
jgi:hypothetical protein